MKMNTSAEYLSQAIRSTELRNIMNKKCNLSCLHFHLYQIVGDMIHLVEYGFLTLSFVYLNNL